MLQDRVPQARIYKMWNIPGYNTRDFTLLDIAADVLGSGKNSRLYKRLVYTDQTATSVSASASARSRSARSSRSSSTVKPGGDVRAVEKALDEEVARVPAQRARRPRSSSASGPRRLRGLRARHRAHRRLRRQVLHPRARARCTAARRISTRQQLDWVGRRDAGRRAGRREALAVGRRVRAQRRSRRRNTRVASTARIAASCPATGTPPRLKLPPLQRATLSNGLKVVLVERHNAPVVDLTLIVDAGFAADSSPSPARRGSTMLDAPGRHEDAQFAADRRARGDARRADRRRLVARYVVHQHERAHQQAGGVARAVQRRAAEPDLPARRSSTRLQGADARGHPAGEGAAAGHRHAPVPGADLRRGPCVLESVLRHGSPRDRHGADARGARGVLQALGAARQRDAADRRRHDARQIKPLLEQRLAAWKAPAEALPKKNLAAVAQQAKPRVFLVNRTGAEQSQIVARLRGPAALRSGLHRVRDAEHDARRQLRVAPQHEPARGQALVVRRGLATRRRRTGRGRSSCARPVQTDKTAESMQEIRKELRDVLGARPPTERRSSSRGTASCCAARQQRDVGRGRRLVWRDPHLRPEGQLLERLRRRSERR